MELTHFQSLGDYPDTKNCMKDINDAKMLMNPYSGKDGELTSIMLYVYQSYITKPFDKNISDTIEQIARVEMKHHELLADAIVNLGGDPVFRGLGPFWTAEYVNYNKNVKQFLLFNIKLEEIAIMNYKKVAQFVSCDEIRELALRIIKDEELHIKIFTDLLNNIKFWS